MGLYIVLLSSILLFSDFAQAQCPVGWDVVTKKCMMCGVGQKPADAARQSCREADGDLASILDFDQQTYAEGCQSGTFDDIWIGLKGRTTSPFFYWVDGSNYVTPDTFATPVAQPANPAAVAENCFYILATNTWFQVTGVGNEICTSTGTPTARYYVCSRSQTLVAPRGSNNVTYSPTSTPYYPDAEASYSCLPGYKLTGGVATRICQNDGTWSEVEPECVPLDCGPLTVPANGHISSDETTYNSVATYSCNSGYSVGAVSPSRTCQSNGSWSGFGFSCLKVDCGAPATPENGAVNAPATTYGSVATYSCNSNYDLEGSATRTCMATATWSGAAPTCDNTLAIALGASFGGLALIGIIGGLLYFLSRASPAGPAQPRGPYPRPAFNHRTPSYPRPGPPRGAVPPRGRPIPGRPY